MTSQALSDAETSAYKSDLGDRLKSMWMNRKRLLFSNTKVESGKKIPMVKEKKGRGLE